MIYTNIGLHEINSSSLPLGKAKIWKGVDVSRERVNAVRSLLPGATLVVRWYYPEGEQERLLRNPEAGAQEWFNRHRGDMLSGVYYEGLNEIGDGSAHQFLRFEMERLRLMHAASYRSGIGSWSVGVPNENMWSVYRPMLDAMWPTDAVCLHEYWSDRADIDNPWHVCRFALDMIWPYLKDKAIIISEGGRDYLEDTKKGRPGWQLTCNADTFYGDLELVSAKYARFPNVKGMTVFQDGSKDERWKPFGVAPVWNKVVANYQDIPTQAPSIIKMPPIELAPWVVANQRPMTLTEFRQYVRNIPKVPRVYLHHTATARVKWSWQTILNVKGYYESLPWWSGGQQYEGWTAGPHLFIGDEGIWLFTDLSKDGIGVAGHNTNTRHVEMIGTYENSRPDGALLENTVGVFKALKETWGDFEIRFHREDANKTCPGMAVTKDWFMGLFYDPWLPSNDGLIIMAIQSGKLGLMLEKDRWCMEHILRLVENGDIETARAWLRDLVDHDKGLQYIMERRAKELGV